jgi:SAM-dependent methyltransferase
MSWLPGDFSAIHDHGHTVWGAVQIFGAAEHATFRWEDENLNTLARWEVKPGDVLGVGHSLIHQMGNRDQQPFLSLHIYGYNSPIDNVTGDARIFDLDQQKIQRVNGGAFFNLPDSAVARYEDGPAGDFPTYLRHQLELFRRKETAGDPDANELFHKTFDMNQHDLLLTCLSGITDEETGKNINSLQWRILIRELKEAADFQNSHKRISKKDDSFHQYAEIYDHVIGETSMDSFMRKYIHFFVEKYRFDFSSNDTLSIGCGTGLVEKYILEEFNVPKERLYGMDLSESMVVEARKRISADVGDIMTLDPAIRKWDLAYSGLNVFQYLPHEQLEEAIKKTHSVIEDGGYFLADFITPDHIRWYPNTMYSSDKKVISLRTPEIIEVDGANFQESEIINISFLNDQMDVHYAGKHRRFLPPIFRVRSYFEKYFSEVNLYDAHSLKSIDKADDSCPSTRYIVVARK